MSWIKRWLKRAVVLVLVGVVGWYLLGPRSAKDAPDLPLQMDEQTRVDGQRQLSRNPVRSFFIPRTWSQPTFPNSRE